MIRYKFESGYLNILILLFYSFYLSESFCLLTLWNPTETHKQLFTLLKLVQGGKQDFLLVQEQLV
jgi:hypothetical protein